MTMHKPDRIGMAYAASAYVVWGIIPIYWKQIDHVGAIEIVAHRIVWTLIFTFMLVQFRKRSSHVWAALARRRSLAALSVSAILIAMNWCVFIWAVSAGRIIESSLGYYITPLVSFLLGGLVFKERLTRLQTVAVGLAVLGVANQSWAIGYLPWISLVLALSFGVYGLIRKMVSVESVEGLAIETIILVPVSLCYLFYLAATDTGSFGKFGALNDFYLVLAGPVTAIPLLLFAAGARRLPLSVLGFLQYLGPSISLVLAVYLYDEIFTQVHAITFALIWSALALVTWEVFQRERYSAA